MKKTLVVLAAGIGSRYGEGIKQIEPVGKKNEIIMDYSIHDAIAAGFNKIVIVIRKDIEEDFNEIIGNRLRAVCDRLNVELYFTFQDHPKNNPELFPMDRKKPWGTGDAVKAAGKYITEPFAVINADDYYGKKAFGMAVEILESGSAGMIGYRLGNTLSDNGAVTRGVCEVSEGKLTRVLETSNIIKTECGAETDGKKLPLDAIVSMNFWCLPEEFIFELDDEFSLFLENMKDPVKDEFLLPEIVDKMIKKGHTVIVIDSNDKWFGVTYHEDKALVVEEFNKLYEKGEYQEDLYADLIH